MPPMHVTRRVTTGGYPYIKEFRGVGADPCALILIVPVSRPSTRLSRRLHPFSPPIIVPPMHITKRVTTGGYPYIWVCEGVGADPCALILIVPVSRPSTRFDRRSSGAPLRRCGKSIIFVIGGLWAIYVLPTQNPWRPQSRPTSLRKQTGNHGGLPLHPGILRRRGRPLCLP